MRRNIFRSAAVLSILFLGIYFGRLTQLPVVKAAGASRVVHVRVATLGLSGESDVPQRNLSGTDNGTPVAISCTSGDGRNADCYVLMLGN